MFLPARTSRRSTSNSVAEIGPPRFLRALRSFLPSVPSIYLGRRVGDGAPVSLPLWSTEMNVAMNGKTGAGKTTTGQELDFASPFDDMALIAMDFIGTGFHAARTHKAFLGTILMTLERMFPEILTGATDWFLRRFAFGTISYRGDNPIRIDIMKRRRRPDGTMESVQEVVDRVLNVFSMRFDDMDLRVRFRRTAKIVLTVLVAAGRSICEWSRPLDKDDDAYLQFLLREIEANGLAADIFVQRQLQKLLELRALPKSVFEQRTESFANSMDDYDEGTALGTFFGSDETYDPAEATYGNGRFFLTTDLPNETLRKEAFLAVHAINSAHFALRSPGSGRYDLLHYFLDEADKWVPRSILTHMAQARNLGISTWLLFQNIAQWKAAGIDEMADIRESVCSLNADWRPTSMQQAKELYLRTHPIDPMGVLHRLLTRTDSTSRTSSETLTDSWQEAINSSSSITGNESASSGDSADDLGENRRLSRQAQRGNGWSDSHGSSSSTGGSRSTTLGTTVGAAFAEMIIRIPFEEQLSVGAQALLRRPDYQATWSYGGNAVEIDMDPPRKFPEEIGGVNALEYYTRWHDHYWKAKAVARKPFAPAITLAGNALGNVDVPRPPAKSRSTEKPPRSAKSTPTPEAAPDIPVSLSPVTPTADRGIELLRVIALVRLCTIQHILAVLDWSYDKAARELQSLVKAGYADSVRRFAPRGEGSAPIIYILTTAGADRLSANDVENENLRRIAKNLGVFRRTVESNRPAQTEHRLWSSTLQTLLMQSLVGRGARVDDVRFDRERSVRLDLSGSAIPDRLRPLFGPDLQKTAYVPDFSFVAIREKNGRMIRDIILGEVETGFGERDASDLAAVKAWKLQAISKAFYAGRTFDGQVSEPDSELRVVVWTRTDAIEQKFFEGARAVFGDARSPLWITSGDHLPLAIPSGTQKKDIPAAVRRLVDGVQQRVWRWLRFPKPDDRRRFVGIGDSRDA
ncbi:MAG: replication-relaxation family protein [Thermoanaerobaculia bacterium]